jgi:hypothetical protein
MNESDIAAYVDRRLSVAERDRIEQHLAGCRECRNEVVESRRVLMQARRPRLILLGGSVLATAAALLLVLRPAFIFPRADGESARLRNAGAPTTLVAHGPSGEVPLSGLTFVWGAAQGAATYRLTLSGADGVPLWTASTTDTTLALADSVRLGPGKPYFWMTDALLGDGTTRSTGLREFRPTR